MRQAKEIVMMTLFEAGAALLLVLAMFSLFGMDMFRTLTRSRQPIPVRDWRADYCRLRSEGLSRGRNVCSSPQRHGGSRV